MDIVTMHLAAQFAEAAALIDDHKHLFPADRQADAELKVEQLHGYAEVLAGDRLEEIYCQEDAIHA